MKLSAPGPRENGAIEMLAETSPHWVTTTDCDWRIATANRSAAELAGVGAPEELRGRCLLDWLIPEDRSRAERVRQNLVAGAHVEKLDCQVIRTDGTRTPVELVGSVLGSRRQDRFCHLLVIRQVTASRRRANTDRLEALGQMASGIAHDLNQSLALITGYVELARQEVARPHEQIDKRLIAGHLDIAWQAAMDGGHVVKRLLAFVRAHERSIETVNVSVLLDEVGRLTAPRWRDAAQAEGRPITLWVEADADVHVRGDPASLREALTNLVFNAVDALPRGGKVTLTAHEQDQQVVVTVSDTGTGMLPEVRERIFEPFYTTKGDRGTGLGLPQVRAVVQQLGGRIAVESEPCRGTRFWITLPKTDVMTLPVAAVAPSDDAGSGGLRVLLVEDELKLANLASMLLARDHHHVSVVNSGEGALQHLEEHAVDVVVSDLGLGLGMNGWQLAEQVRLRWPGTRMLLATGWGAAIDPEEARSRGVERVVAKPYRAIELRSAVARTADPSEH